ncbi:MAG TPA: hypothetical protein VHB98_08300, partial [Chloroflexota bacterium]|nr:hypothetical protein [Chloroflexota bacterium]
ADGSRLVRTLTDEPIYDALAGDLELYLAEFARRRLFVHAGVVGWRGRAILIPGWSRAGKSTLVAALLRAGATYYSDEYAVLDARGRVHPFPRPLSLRGAPGEHPSKHTSATFGARTGTASLPVGLVLVTRYVAGARWRPRPRSRARAVLDLFANTPSARRKPEAAFHILHQTLGDARVVSGVRGESEAVIEWVLGECVPAGAR